MKKSLLSLFGLVLALLALFASCDDAPGNTAEENFGIPCEINIIASEGGDVQFSDYFGTSKHVYTGSKVTVIATADEGYAFIGWYVVGKNEKLVSDNASYTFVTQGDLQLVAQFGKLQDITISNSDGGSVSFKDSEEKTMHLLPGEEVTVVATVNDGYEFAGWYVGSNLVSKDAEYIFTVSASVNLVAEFLEILSVTVSSTEGGSAVVEGTTEEQKNVLFDESITLKATPTEDYVFVGWFIGDSEEPVSTEATYTFAVSENVSLVAKFRKRVYYNGYEYVDLGLPSGLKWAAYNVGATKPEEYGGYYAWGETDEKERYYESDYLYYKNGSYINIGSDISGTQYDVAHVKWGGTWRMPTKSEQDELRNKCDWEWTIQNGVKGYRITGPNGNSIFLPAAGCRGGGSIYDTGDKGLYWSSSLYSDSSTNAYNLYFRDSHYDRYYYSSRYVGRSVRPVTE